MGFVSIVIFSYLRVRDKSVRIFLFQMQTQGTCSRSELFSKTTVCGLLLFFIFSVQFELHTMSFYHICIPSYMYIQIRMFVNTQVIYKLSCFLNEQMYVYFLWWRRFLPFRWSTFPDDTYLYRLVYHSISCHDGIMRSSNNIFFFKNRSDYEINQWVHFLS